MARLLGPLCFSAKISACGFTDSKRNSFLSVFTFVKGVRSSTTGLKYQPPTYFCIAFSSNHQTTYHLDPRFLAFVGRFFMCSWSSPTFCSGSVSLSVYPYTTTSSAPYHHVHTLSLLSPEEGEEEWLGGVGMQGGFGEAVMLESGPAVWAAEHLEVLRAFWCLMKRAS